jgi:orotate phosphoribosyltransferase
MNRKIAKLLLSHNCIQLSPSQPFTYASGLKGPIYCDNRKLLSHVEARAEVIQAFAELVRSESFKYDKIAGLATAGIPHAALLAHELKEPMIYIRSKPKGHGKGNQVEGDFQSGEKLLLVEDLVNQASSLQEAVEGAAAAGLSAVACLCIVDYEMARAKERVLEMNFPLYSLTDFSTIASVGQEMKLLSADEHRLLMDWQSDPESWSAKVQS